jgi:hypothetical protein
MGTVNLNVFTDGSWVDIDVDDVGIGAEFVELAVTRSSKRRRWPPGDRSSERHLAECHMNAQHAQPLFMSAGKTAQTIKVVVSGRNISANRVNSS